MSTAQPELDFATARARSTDPSTSFQAARSIRGNEATRMEELVLETLRDHSVGLTSHELATLTGLSLVSVSPRLRPLVSKGLVVDSGERRAGDSGRKSIVWKAVRTGSN